MPWKGEKDPYKIWLSEIILQQTRVEQGLAYYNRFIKRYPGIKKLAAADEKDVFKLWEGLGYYSRCRNLIATAKFIASEYNGTFPGTYEEILKLKGVGPYTAAAIASFAFDLPHAVLDGNVFRVLARVFGITTPIDSTIGKKKFTTLAHQLLHKKNPAVYNQAVMDFGATVCKPLMPLCKNCIFQSTCIAFKNGDITGLPVKSKKLRQKKRFFYFILMNHQNRIAIRERTEKDIWRHLHEFPLVETHGELPIEKLSQKLAKLGWVNSASPFEISKLYKQKLTHQTVEALFICVKIKQRPPALKNYSWVSCKDLKNYSFPKIINDYIRTLD